MSDQFDFGSYAPSMVAGSRSGSMKKLTRKTDKSPQPVDSKPLKKNDDLDEFEQLLNLDSKPKKKDTSLTKNNSSSLQKKGGDSLDDFFDEPSTTLNLGMTSKITDKKEPTNKNMDLARTSINFKPAQKKSDFDIIDEDHGFMPSFSKDKNRSQSPTANQIKMPEENSFALESHTSMRNMRPPLKRKESVTGLGQKTPMNLGLSLAEEKKQTTIKPSMGLGLSLDDETDFKPSRSSNFGRRGSIDSKSQKKFQTNLTLLGQQPARKQSNISHFNIPQPSALKIDSPKIKKSQISQMKIGQSIMLNQKHSHFYNNTSMLNNQTTSIMNNNPTYNKPSMPQVILQSKNSSNYSFERSQPKLAEPPKLSPNVIEHSVSQQPYDYQKELEHVKQAYQKQLTYLQESLDKQIQIGNQTRERLMKEANSMIEEERRRATRIHEEEIKRLKEMNEWEKQKMSSSYQFEIQGLKATISQYQKSSKTTSPLHYEDTSAMRHKRQIQQLSEQLSLQKKLLSDRESHLTKRQLQLQEKMQQLNSKRVKQQEYFREQQKNLMEKENKLRNQILAEKKDFMDEKQKIAIEAANMELEFMKRKEKLELILKEQQMEKQAIQNERHEMRLLNQQMMAKYKEKMAELAQEKQSVANLQADLIRKIRIIELKAKQTNVPLTNNTAKENNWVKQRPHSTAGQKQQKLNETFQRYNKVEKIANQNQKSTLSSKMNKTISENNNNFKLEEYLVAMNKHSKTRNNNFM